MTENEQKDLETLKTDIQECKLRFYDYALYITRMNPTELEQAGHRNKTVAEALLSVYQNSQKELKKLTDAHIRKYPD